MFGRRSRMRMPFCASSWKKGAGLSSFGARSFVCGVMKRSPSTDVARMPAPASLTSSDTPALQYNPAMSNPAADPLRDRTADFGYEQVPWSEKADRVRRVFDSVAGKYDLMNDLMSGGLHRYWKQFTLSRTGLRPGQRALDVAGGTGDLTRGLSKQVGEGGLVVLSDINAAMLARGREKLIDRGILG